MAYFKMGIDVAVIRASVYANLVRQVRAGAKELSKMKKVDFSKKNNKKVIQKFVYITKMLYLCSVKRLNNKQNELE